MKIINIYPILNTSKIYDQPMSLALVHLVLKYPAYAKSFKKYNGYKILDNSIIELGAAFSLDAILKAADEIDADEIILPDVLGDYEATIKNIKKSINELKSKNLIGKYKLMGVVQGKDYEDFKKCYEELSKINEIDVIGIPKISARFFKNHNRVSCEKVWLNTDHKPIHLLGLGNSFSELTLYANPDDIRSCDTSLKSVLAKNNKTLLDSRDFNDVIDLENDYITETEYSRV